MRVQYCWCICVCIECLALSHHGLNDCSVLDQAGHRRTHTELQEHLPVDDNGVNALLRKFQSG